MQMIIIYDIGKKRNSIIYYIFIAFKLLSREPSRPFNKISQREAFFVRKKSARGRRKKNKWKAAEMLFKNDHSSDRAVAVIGFKRDFYERER